MNFKYFIRVTALTLLFSVSCHSFLFSQGKIVCSNTILKDIVNQIVPTHYKVVSIVPYNADPHIYEPVSSDIQQIISANAVIVNGLRLEPWFENLVLQSGYSGKVIVASSTSNNMKVNGHDSWDPHAWMNPQNMIHYVEHISDELCKVFFQDAEQLRENAEAYKLQLLQLDGEIKQLLSRIPNDQRILITMHSSFNYFTERYQLQSEPIMGLSTEADIQVRDVLRVSRILNKGSVKVVFSESTLYPKFIEMLTNDFGGHVATSLYADALSDELGPAHSYDNMMRHNATLIANNLTQNDINRKNINHFSFYELLALIGLFIAILSFYLFYVFSSRI